MLITILAVIGAAATVVLVVAAFRSKTFLLQRSTVIEAPADRLYGLIQDLKAFNTWNPFAKMDSNLNVQYDSITQGNGAAYSWNGAKAGIGRMQVTEAVPSERVTMSLDFTKPMEAHNTVVFSLRPQGAGTQVTWAMSGKMPYMHRVMTLFFSMDKMVGVQFEQGLASLKVLAESPR
ncbi:MAG: SRPBCC family protein [Bryobacteraceae bacterium]